MKKISLCLFVFIFNMSLFAQWNTIKNGALWKDTQGNAVQAHGAGFLQVGNKWYMVGEDRSYSNAGVNLYSSSDLVTWKFEKKIIPPSAYRSDRFIERPKLLRCPSTGKFVVWCHYEGANYAPSEAASFYCDSVNGLYTLSYSGRPFNIASRDCNVFVDNDGKGYFVSTTDGNANLTLFELSTDYLTPVASTKLSTFNGKSREAPAIVRVGNTYFLISSKCTGWDPNQATISHSTSLTSGWTTMTNIGNGISFDTQAASVLTIRGTSGTTYLYVGDRWKDPELAESKTIIFPISFSGTSCTFNYRQQFDIDFSTGLTRETPLTNRVPKTGWKIRSFSSQETSGENGAATNAIDGNLATKWHTKYSGSVASAPHFIEVDMGSDYNFSGLLCAPRQDNSINGIIREFVFSTSTDGVTWTPRAGSDWMPYYTEIYFKPVQARYFRFTAVSGSFASISEIDLLQNTPDYSTQTISTLYQLGPITTGAWKSSANISVNNGNCLNFGPTDIDGGTWAWGGQNSDDNWVGRQISIPNISTSGVYTGLFLNKYYCVSSVNFNVTVVKDAGYAKRKLQNVITKAQKINGISIKGYDELLIVIFEAQTLIQNTNTTYQEYIDQLKKLNSAISKFYNQLILSSQNLTDKIITNKDFKSTSPTGWEGTILSSTGSNTGSFSNKTFDMYQTITNLENGKYLIGCQSFYRPGANDGGNNYSYGIDNTNALLYANENSMNITSLYNISYIGENNLYGYVNDTISANSVFTASSENCANWALADVKDGVLKIGIKKTLNITNDWFCFNNFSLYKIDDGLMGVDDVLIENEKIDGPVFGFDGRYYGTGTLQTLHLKPGLYVSNGRKFYVK